jgi:hypothetical protein
LQEETVLLRTIAAAYSSAAVGEVAEELSGGFAVPPIPQQRPGLDSVPERAAP